MENTWPFTSKTAGVIDKRLLAHLTSKSTDPRPVPIEYIEYKIMKHMGWTERELKEASAETVLRIWSYMQTELAARR